MKVFDLDVNGARRRVETDGESRLLGVLRDDLDLMGTKYGCGEGQCGACTVLLDGEATRSCLTPVAAAVGHRITTVEGLERDGQLHPVQQAFLDEDAMQCGYCIPGMIMSSVGLLEKNPAPSRDEIVQAMDGNVCRCGSYPRIVAAIDRAAAAAKSRKGGSR